MLQCPHCGGSDSTVLETRGTLYKGTVYRRRRCKSCKQRFSTEEAIIAAEKSEARN